jgi:hypothetical protein
MGLDAREQFQGLRAYVTLRSGLPSHPRCLEVPIPATIHLLGEKVAGFRERCPEGGGLDALQELGVLGLNQ